MLVAHDEAGDHLTRLAAHQRGRRRVAEEVGRRLIGEHHPAVAAADRDRLCDAGEDGFEPALRLPQIRVQKRVVERERGAPRDLDDQVEVVLVVGDAFAETQHRQGPEDASPSDERGDDDRSVVVGRHERCVLVASREGYERSGRNVREELRPPAAQHPCHRMLARRIERVARADRLERLRHARGSRRDGDAGDRPVLLASVDHAQVREPRNGEPGHLTHRRRGVERAREDRAGLDQKLAGQRGARRRHVLHAMLQASISTALGPSWHAFSLCRNRLDRPAPGARRRSHCELPATGRSATH